MLAISFVVVFALSKARDNQLSKYPVIDGASCRALPNSDSMSEMQKNAILEYLNNKKMEETEYEANFGIGFLQCFCDARSSMGDDKKASYEYKGENYAICQDYFDNKFQTFVLKNAVKGSIIGINYILRLTIRKLVTWIGYHTQSR